MLSYLFSQVTRWGLDVLEQNSCQINECFFLWWFDNFMWWLKYIYNKEIVAFIFVSYIKHIYIPYFVYGYIICLYVYTICYKYILFYILYIFTFIYIVYIYIYIYILSYLISQMYIYNFICIYMCILGNLNEEIKGEGTCKKKKRGKERFLYSI